MNLENRKRELVKEFSPLLLKSTKWNKIWMVILTAIILVGLYAFFVQLIKGHVVTGMRDNVVWGVYIINFIFFFRSLLGMCLMTI